MGLPSARAGCQALPAGVSPPLRTRSSLVFVVFRSLSSIRDFSGPFEYIDRLALSVSSFTSSCARLLHALCPVTTPTTTATTNSPHIQAQPRASSRSRALLDCLPCPTRRSLSRCCCCCYCRKPNAARHCKSKGAFTCFALPCLALPRPANWYFAIGPAYRIQRVCWSLDSSRLASTVCSSRTHDAISLQPPLGLPVCFQLPNHLQQQHRLALRSPSPPALPPHELSSCSRAPATPSDVD